MTNPYCETFQRHLRPLEPIPTGEVPVLRQLAGIRAVLFDVYGTLLLSDSGDVGTAAERAAAEDDGPESPLDGALRAMAIPTSAPAGQGIDLLDELIDRSHARSRDRGIDYPEVDIVEIWREVLAELARRGVIKQPALATINPERLAVEYEARANPCWPMPHLRECLDRLRQGGLVLGLISNAQFYTPVLFEALLGRSAQEYGFPQDLQFYSCHFGSAKPGPEMFRGALAALAGRGIEPAEALYLGNDMLNDVLPASRLGLRTALFAGDARSLRHRHEHPDIEDLSPDLIVTDLAQLAQCVMI